MLLKILLSKKFWINFLEMLVLIFVTFTLVFILMHIVPGQTGKLANSSLPVDQQVQLLRQYGLDRPLASQFFIYLSGVFTRLDFGISLSVRTNDLVTNILTPKIGISFLLGAIALLISFFLGYFLGAVIGMNQKNIFGAMGHLTIALFLAVPSYMLGIIVVAVASALNRVELVLFDFDLPYTWILPILILSIPYVISFANLVSGVIMTESRAQYIKFARAKGLNSFQILIKHLFKRGIFSSVVVLPTYIVGVLINGLFIDSVFSIPGIGSVLSAAILSKDYDIVQTLILLFAFLNSFAFWLRDFLLTITDPRLMTTL